MNKTDQPTNTSGYAYFNEDAGMEWTPDHPVISGQVPDATEIEPMTLAEFKRRWNDDEPV